MQSLREEAKRIVYVEEFILIYDVDCVLQFVLLWQI